MSVPKAYCHSCKREWLKPGDIDPNLLRIGQLEAEVRRYASEAVMANTKVEQLEAALRLAEDVLKAVQRTYDCPNSPIINLTLQSISAALDQSSPSPLQASHNPGERLRNSDVAVGEGETPPARQENDDVFPGFRGNNDSA